VHYPMDIFTQLPPNRSTIFAMSHLDFPTMCLLFCRGECEHAMLFCPSARGVCADVKEFGIPLNRKFFASPQDWLVDFTSKCNGIQSTVLAASF
jgi:hypothetical protein